jgi:PAS domain S-box-containing protein
MTLTTQVQGDPRLEPDSTPAGLLDELSVSFHKVGRALSLSPNQDEVLSLLADSAALVGRADCAAVHLLEDDRRLLLKASGGAYRGSLDSLRAIVEGEVGDMVLAHRQPAYATRSDGGISPSDPDRCEAYLVVPLVLRGQALGSISLGRRSPVSFHSAEVDVLASLAAQTALLLENTRLFSALQDKLREIGGLYDVSLAFASMPHLENTLGEIVERIAELLQVERCAILLPDDTGTSVVAQPQAFGFSQLEIAGLRLSLSGSNAAAQVWANGRAYLTNDVQSDPAERHPFARAFGESSLLLIPLLVESRPIGLVRASNKRGGRFTSNDIRLLTIFGMQAAVVLRNAMLYREVAEERQRLRAIFDNASDGIMIIGNDRRITAFNPAMEILTGLKAAQAIGRPCSEIYHGGDKDGRVHCATKCPLGPYTGCLSAEPYVETTIASRDGRKHEVAIGYSALDGTGTGPEHTSGQVVAIVRDVTRAKQLERAQAQFVATVSHELRTPLASIKASVGLLNASIPADSPDAILRLIANIDRSTVRLESLVSDLLDLARLRSGRVRLSFQRFDLVEAANEALATMRPLMDAKRQTTSMAAPARGCHVVGDRQRIGQVLLNLLSNANKYTPAGGEIEIRIRSRGSDVEFEVQDNGPGIAPEEHERVFEQFYRSENGSPDTTVGTGLGLPIAKALIDLHGGTIGVLSALGKGSTFSFAIPRRGRDGATDPI